MKCRYCYGKGDKSAVFCPNCGKPMYRNEVNGPALLLSCVSILSGIILFFVLESSENVAWAIISVLGLPVLGSLPMIVADNNAKLINADIKTIAEISNSSESEAHAVFTNKSKAIYQKPIIINVLTVVGTICFLVGLSYFWNGGDRELISFGLGVILFILGVAIYSMKTKRYKLYLKRERAFELFCEAVERDERARVSKGNSYSGSYSRLDNGAKIAGIYAGLKLTDELFGGRKKR